MLLFRCVYKFYSHVNYSVTKIEADVRQEYHMFYSHVNYSVTKISYDCDYIKNMFYSHVNYSVTKIYIMNNRKSLCFTVT